jgi:hypothetical protein
MAGSENPGAATNIFHRRHFIMRRILALCAAAGLGLAALAATSPAEAAFHLIRWDVTGFCQVWDESLPIKPFPSDYKTVSRPVPTFVSALSVKEKLMRKRVCTF